MRARGWACCLALCGCYTLSGVTQHNVDAWNGPRNPAPAGVAEQLTYVPAPAGELPSVSVRSTPQCRELETGERAVVETRTYRQYQWPLFLGLGATAAAGITALALIPTQWDASTRQSEDVALGLVVGASIVTLMLWALTPSERTRDEELRREPVAHITGHVHPCANAADAPVPARPLAVEAGFANNGRPLAGQIQTDASGQAKLNLWPVAGAVGAHCGQATVTVRDPAAAAGWPESQEPDGGLVVAEPLRLPVPPLPGQPGASISDADGRTLAAECDAAQRSAR